MKIIIYFVELSNNVSSTLLIGKFYDSATVVIYLIINFLFHRCHLLRDDVVFVDR